VPDTVVLVDQIPYDDLGKVRRRSLSTMITDSTERSP
jgi:acyl-coenzyme A synthetase/AMP-(fatty) acid ligase